MISTISDVAVDRPIPLSEPLIAGNELRYVADCLNGGWVSTAGRYVDRFEADICRFSGAQHAVACVNGTAGLHLSLQLAGVTAGDEVIVPTLTFIAPVNAVRYLHAEPVFMDCDAFMNMDAQKFHDFCTEECELTEFGLRNKVSGRIIKAVVPVHVFGNPCDIASIIGTARSCALSVIEDATESLGASYTSGEWAGRRTGTVGDLGVYSFNGNKIITTGGGGMIVTNNEEMGKKARYLSTQAKDDSVRYLHHEVGYNYRLTNIQAALGVAQLEHLEMFIERKKINYELYQRELEGIQGVGMLGIPEGTNPNYWFYSLLVEEEEYGMSREALRQLLGQDSIQTRPIWYLNHLQRPYQGNQSYRIERAWWFWQRVLNIPCSVSLDEGMIRRVAGCIRRHCK